jgi:acetyltransferase EpsM
MQRPPVALFGAGGHAKVILELLEEAGRSVHGFVADKPEISVMLGYAVQSWSAYQPEDVEWIIAIGDNATRRKKAALVGSRFARVAHRGSYISSRTVWGEGSVVMSGASIHSGATLGAHCIVNTHASVDHDCHLGDFVHIAPHAALCGHVEIGEGTLIGAGAVVVPGVKIGRWSVIGAGSVIRNDIPDGVLVAGNPGRIFLKKDIL